MMCRCKMLYKQETQQGCVRSGQKDVCITYVVHKHYHELTVLRAWFLRALRENLSLASVTASGGLLAIWHFLDYSCITPVSAFLSCVLPHVSVCVQTSPLHKEDRCIGLGLTHVTSSELITSTVSQFPNKLVFWVIGRWDYKTRIWGKGGHTSTQFNTEKLRSLKEEERILEAEDPSKEQWSFPYLLSPSPQPMI